MKIRKKHPVAFAVYSILIVVLLNACQTATFNSPQPLGIGSLGDFPHRLRGTYVNKQENPTLRITDKLVIKTYNWVGKIPKNSSDSTYKILNNVLVNADGAEKYPVKVDGDSVLIDIHISDTIFSVSEQNVLKKFKGYYFLNLKVDSNSWSVNMLSLNKGKLSISQIGSREDIDKLREITEAIADTTNYNFAPTQIQFQKFIKQNGFSDVDEFARTKN